MTIEERVKQMVPEVEQFLLDWFGERQRECVENDEDWRIALFESASRLFALVSKALLLNPNPSQEAWKEVLCAGAVIAATARAELETAEPLN